MFPNEIFQSTLQKASAIFRRASPTEQEKIQKLAAQLNLQPLLQELLTEQDEIG